jgi:hypothetical protein
MDMVDILEKYPVIDRLAWLGICPNPIRDDFNAVMKYISTKEYKEGSESGVGEIPEHVASSIRKITDYTGKYGRIPECILDFAAMRRNREKGDDGKSVCAVCNAGFWDKLMENGNLLI